MEIIILGSGGAQPPPRPTCNCKICEQARKKGIPYYRTGPSLYLPESSVLFDLPEEIREQLNRERIETVNHVFLSHWHPDHTMGVRIFEQMNQQFLGVRPTKKSILYLSKETDHTLRTKMLPSFLSLYERRGLIETHLIKSGDTIKFGKVEITCYDVPEKDVFIFKICDGISSVVYAPCDVKNFPIIDGLMNPDILIHQLGFFDELIPTNLKISAHAEEDSFTKNLETIKRIGAKKTIFTHIEEDWGKSYEDFLRMESELAGFHISFAYDGMRLQV
jgi:phosphoribosyl 1,2-cyclic phosphate phosphodiesterase